MGWEAFPLALHDRVVPCVPVPKEGQGQADTSRWTPPPSKFNLSLNPNFPRAEQTRVQTAVSFLQVGLSKPSGIAANHPSAASFLQEFAAQFRGQFPVTHQYIDSKRDAYLYVLLPLLADVNKVGIAKEVKLQGSVFTTRITQTWRLMYEGPKLGKRQQILRDVP